MPQLGRTGASAADPGQRRSDRERQWVPPCAGKCREGDCARPQFGDSYMALGLVQINHDWDWEGADESLEKASVLEPGSATVLGNRAYLARNLGQLEKAIELRREAIALDPLRANFHLALGYELLLLGRFDEAKAALQRAQELNPQLSSLHLTRGTILLLEDTNLSLWRRWRRKPENGRNCRRIHGLLCASAPRGLDRCPE